MYISVVQQYPNVGIPELEIVSPCSKNNVKKKILSGVNQRRY